VPISVQAFRDECSAPLRLRLLAGERGMGRRITGSRVQEAGLALAGEVFPSREGVIESCISPPSGCRVKTFINSIPKNIVFL